MMKLAMSAYDPARVVIDVVRAGMGLVDMCATQCRIAPGS